MEAARLVRPKRTTASTNSTSRSSTRDRSEAPPLDDDADRRGWQEREIRKSDPAGVEAAGETTIATRRLREAAARRASDEDFTAVPLDCYHQTGR